MSGNGTTKPFGNGEQTNGNGNTGSSREDVRGQHEKSSSKARLLRVLVLGLVLYTLDVSLHITIASQYLDMRNCHRGLQTQFYDFNLGNLLGAAVVLPNETSTMPTPAQLARANRTLVAGLINEQTYILVREKAISLVPQHWVDKIEEVVSFQLKNYNPAQVADFCTFNGKKFESTIDIGYYVCEDALEAEQVAALRRITDEISSEEEAVIMGAFIKGDYIGAAMAAPAAIGLDIPPRVFEIVNQVMSKLTADDYKELGKLIGDPLVADGLPDFLEAVGQIEPADIELLKGAMGKVVPENIPKIDKLLGKLGVTLFGFISNPSLLIKFFRDPELAVALTEMRKLLPIFTSSDLNAMIKMQKLFQSSPKAGYVMQAAFKLPLTLTGKITSIEIGPGDFEMMMSLKGLMDDERIQAVLAVAKELNLMSSNGRSAVLSQCAHDVLDIKCEDDTVDLCPNGHLLYGLITLMTIFSPGLAFGFSEFMHFKAFRFGSLFGKMYGQDWNRLAKWAMLPVYLIIMQPLTIVITIFSYYRALSKIFRQKAPSAIQESYDAALNLHSLEASSNSHFQIIIQLHFLTVLVVMGMGTIIEGMPVAEVFQRVVPITVISICVSWLNYSYTSWKLMTLDHRVQGLPRKGSRIVNFISFYAWFSVSKVTVIISLLLLSIIGWLEMFGNPSILPYASPINEFIVPVIILYLSFGVNQYLHKKYVQEDGPYSMAHGALSAVFPARFLHRTNRSQTKRFLMSNQFVAWFVHVAAWFVYSIIMYAMYGEGTGMLNILPIMAALASFGPFLGIIHWAKVINPAYRGGHKKKDESELPPLTKAILFRVWQIHTAVVRLTSLILLFYVYIDHWAQIKIALVYLLPYLALLIVANAGLQLGFFARSDLITQGVLSALIPNNFRRGTVGRAGRYIALNYVMNLSLQLILWLSMTFYCWECTKELDEHFAKLSSCFPPAIVLWMVNMVLTLLAWRFSIRHSLDETRGEKEYGKGGGQDNKAMDEAWTEKESSVTTKF
jgi:hypothetical protein